MGIAYCLIRTAPEVVDQLRGRPKAVAKFTYQDDYVYEAPNPGFLGRLLGSGRGKDGPVPDRREGDETDLDKSWHLVHYLLSGSSGRGESPLGLIGDDSNPLADIDLGLGKPNVISPSEVQAFAQATAAMSDADFLTRFKPDEMPVEELYMGDVIARGDHDDMMEYSLEYFHILRDFAAKAAANGEAIITYYT